MQNVRVKTKEAEMEAMSMEIKSIRRHHEAVSEAMCMEKQALREKEEEFLDLREKEEEFLDLREEEEEFLDLSAATNIAVEMHTIATSNEDVHYNADAGGTHHGV